MGQNINLSNFSKFWNFYISLNISSSIHLRVNQKTLKLQLLQNIWISGKIYLNSFTKSLLFHLKVLIEYRCKPFQISTGQRLWLRSLWNLWHSHAPKLPSVDIDPLRRVSACKLYVAKLHAFENYLQKLKKHYEPKVSNTSVYQHICKAVGLLKSCLSKYASHWIIWNVMQHTLARF